MNWPNVPLGDVAEIERNAVAPSAIKSGTLYVGLEHIQSGGMLLDVQPVNVGDLASNKFVFTPNHVLFGKLRPYLAKIARPQFSGICSTDILPILPGEQLNRDYLAHFLLTPTMVARASSLSTGANLPRLSPQALADLTIPLPPLPEQRRIGAILDKADELRAARRRALAQLDTLTQSIFLEMFGDPATNPKGWTKEPLGTFISTGPQNGLYKPASEYGTGTRILRIDGFYSGEVTDVSKFKRVKLSSAESTLYGLREGEVVINRVNSREYLGKSAIIPPLSEPMVFESNIMRFDVDREYLHPRYLIAYLQTAFVRTHVQRAAKDAVNQSSINQSDVKAIPVIAPPIELQAQFADAVMRTNRTRRTSERSIMGIDALFLSLQHRAFRGEL